MLVRVTVLPGAAVPHWYVPLSAELCQVGDLYMGIGLGEYAPALKF